MRVTCRQIAARYFGLRHSVHLVNTFFVCGVRQIVNRMIIHKLDTWRVEMQIAAFRKCQIIQIKAERMSSVVCICSCFLFSDESYLRATYRLKWIIMGYLSFGKGQVDFDFERSYLVRSYYNKNELLKKFKFHNMRI